MAKKTAAEEKAEQAAAIAKAIEQAVGAWSPIALLAYKGVKRLVDRLKARGELTPEEAAAFDADIAEAEAILAEMDVRSADYKRLRAEEQALQSNEASKP